MNSIQTHTQGIFRLQIKINFFMHLEDGILNFHLDARLLFLRAIINEFHQQLSPLRSIVDKIKKLAKGCFVMVSKTFFVTATKRCGLMGLVGFVVKADNSLKCRA